MSYGRAAKLLEDVLPLGAATRASSIKAQVRRAGEAMVTEAYHSAEHFFESQPLVFPEPPRGQAAHVLELDAGYVRAVAGRCGGRKSFGIITSRLIKPDGPGCWHAFTLEGTLSPLTQLHHFLHRQGVPMNAPLAIISDGGEDVAYPSYLPWRPVQRILDWWHVSRRFEHVLQRLRGLRKTEPSVAATLLKRVESAKWRLWHGRAAGCLKQLKAVQLGCSGLLLTRLVELIAYLEKNSFRLVHYAERYRTGLPDFHQRGRVGGRVGHRRPLQEEPQDAVDARGSQRAAAHPRRGPQRGTRQRAQAAALEAAKTYVYV